MQLLVLYFHEVQKSIFLYGRLQCFQECDLWTVLTEIGEILLHLQIDFFKWCCPYERKFSFTYCWSERQQFHWHWFKIHMNFNGSVVYQHPLYLKNIWQCVHDCSSQRILIPFKSSLSPPPHTSFWCNTKNLDWVCSDLSLILSRCCFSWNATLAMLPNATFFTCFFHVWLWILVERYYWDT